MAKAEAELAKIQAGLGKRQLKTAAQVQARVERVLAERRVAPLYQVTVSEADGRTDADLGGGRRSSGAGGSAGWLLRAADAVCPSSGPIAAPCCGCGSRKAKSSGGFRIGKGRCRCGRCL